MILCQFVSAMKPCHKKTYKNSFKIKKKCWKQSGSLYVHVGEDEFLDLFRCTGKGDNPVLEYLTDKKIESTY